MLTVISGEALGELRKLPNESVQICVTSPPYWGLRDYGTAAWEGGDASCDHREETIRIRRNLAEAANACDGGNRSAENRLDKDTLGIPFRDECGKCGARRIDSQIGLEKTPEEYVAKLVEVLREVRRVLRKDGTLWLNLGDSYASGKGTCYNPGGGETSLGQERKAEGVHPLDRGNKSTLAASGLKPKDLIGIPWRVAFALQADGWWLRSDIIWNKPNPMPESVTDRPTKSHEYLFLLSKSANYYYDAEAIKEKGDTMRERFRPNGLSQVENKSSPLGFDNSCGADGSRNKRSVWTVATAPYPEAHFATYPPDLIKPCIMAGTSAKGCCVRCGAPWERIVQRESVSPVDYEGKYLATDPNSAGRRMLANVRARRMSGEDHDKPFPSAKTLGWQPTCRCEWDNGGPIPQGNNLVPCTVIDPFAGSGTTGEVSLELGRKAILIELNPDYVKLIERRCDVTLGLALA